MSNYKLNIKRDVDICGGFSDCNDYILNLPRGYRFNDDLNHVRGFDSIKELKQAAKNDVIPCNCADCLDLQ